MFVDIFQQPIGASHTLYVLSLAHLELLVHPRCPTHIERVCKVCESYPSLDCYLRECILCACGVFGLFIHQGPMEDLSPLVFANI